MNLNNFTTEPISKLFFRYLVPSICGTMVTSIYVLADTIIIGKGIGTDAMAALNIALPVYNLFFGTGLLFGVGGSVMMSICRGHGEHSKGNAYFSLSFLLNVLACIIYMIICNTFTKEIALFLGATDVTLPYVMDYLPYITWSLPVFAFSSFLQTFIRNDGAPKLAMTAVVSGGIFNVIFDYILVYPCQMGMAGAAIATVCGSILTVLILLIHFFGKHNHLHFCFSEIRSSFGSDIFKSGFASFLIDLSSGIVIFFFNQQLLRYQGDLGVSVYGIISNTAIVVTCLSNGICQAAQPIISTNFGAGFQERIDHVRKLGLRTALFICAIPTLLGLTVPNLFTYIFLNPDSQVLALAPAAVRLYFIGFLITGVNMFLIGYFQSTIRPIYALTLCLMRGCVLSIIFVKILPIFLGLNGIWISVPLAELFTLLTGILLLKKSMAKKTTKYLLLFEADTTQNTNSLRR